MMRKGQISVEFLLVGAFMFALAGLLLASADSVLRDTSSLGKAAAARNAVDSVASFVNLAVAQGNGSRVSGQVMVPADGICFILGTYGGNTVVECDVPSAGMVSSRPVYAGSVSFSASCPPTDTRPGWYYLVVSNSAGAISVSCTRLG